MQEQIFVGRQNELDQLGRYLDSMLAGHGQGCFIVGQSGTGKTALLCQWSQCQALAERGLEMAGQSRLRFMHAGFSMHRGAALVWQGRVEEGIVVLRQGFDALLATGTRMLLACWYTRLGESYLLAGRRQEGLEAVEESFRHNEEAWWLPEQHRVHAELLLLAPGNEAEAEVEFRKALEIARGQGSRSLELRSAMSLARLLRKQDRAAEGKDILARCYAWFTEGFDTPDLREAKELLGQLD